MDSKSKVDYRKQPSAFFLQQVEIKNCEHFHDDGFIYLFVNQETKKIETVTQFY